jgi:hypothetical protein
LATSLLRHAIEEIADGKSRKEREYEFIGRMVDLAQLMHAQSFEMQEQWEIKIPHTEENAGSGRMRVRQVIPSSGDVPVYVHTTKTEFDEQGDCDEVNLPSTQSHFKQYEMLADKGMLKDRYFFAVEGSELVWHLDMYYVRGSKAGEKKYTQWCRLELEVPDRNQPLPPFPVQLEDLIASQKGNRSEEEEAKIKMLFEHEFLTPNKYRK